MIMHYTTVLTASKKENDTNYQFEIFYRWAVIVTLQSAKTTLLAWHYFWREELGYFLNRPRIYTNIYTVYYSLRKYVQAQS